MRSKNEKSIESEVTDINLFNFKLNFFYVQIKIHNFYLFVKFKFYFSIEFQ